jgi:hypothetical protein
LASPNGNAVGLVRAVTDDEHGTTSSPNEEEHLRIATLIGTMGLALLGGTASAQDVTYDYDKGTDFSGVRTYAWVGGTNLNDELNHERVVGAVDAQLAARGLTEVDSSESPDVLVVYRVGFEHDLAVNGSGYHYRGRGGPSSARVERVVTGTLAVGMIDAKTHQVVWRATASRDVDADASPEKREKNINKAVEKMFKHYPEGR